MSNRSTTRTVVLSGVVLLALIVLVVAAVLIVKDSTSSNDEAGSATTIVQTTVAPTSQAPETTRTTATPESTHTRPTGEPGSVIYQLTGDGEVIGVTYRSGNKRQVVAVTGTPWQQRTTLTGKHAEITGVVVRGRITCTIMQGEELLASSTSSVGPFSCTARLPR